MAATRARWFWIALLPVAGLFLFQGVRLARVMVTWGDESAYVHLGWLAVTGQVSLFQDELVGHRMPLPFYLVGLTQLPWGPDLLVARLASLAEGLLALVLAAVVARRLAGPLAGLLAALFLATQGVVVGYFATALYHSLTNATLLGGLALILCGRPPWGRLSGMAVIALLVLTRTNLIPVVPAVLGVLLVAARDRRERMALVAVTLLPPAAFFLWDPRHLKVLAYVPLLARVVEPLGYHPIASLLERPPEALASQLWAFVLFARRFEYWALAAALLVACLLWRWARGLAVRPFGGSREASLVAALLLYTYVWQLMIHRARFKEVMGYFHSFAALVPVVLGVGFGILLTHQDWTPRRRAAIAALLIPLLVAPAMIIRHPLLPSGPWAGRPPLEDLGRAADHFRRVIPAEARIFLFGYSMPLYLAGRSPYLRQIHDPGNVSVARDRRAIERNGLWGIAEIDRWLGADADYAVILPPLLDHYRPTRRAAVERMEALLAARFERAARVDEYPWWVYEVYVRRR